MATMCGIVTAEISYQLGFHGGSISGTSYSAGADYLSLAGGILAAID